MSDCGCDHGYVRSFEGMGEWQHLVCSKCGGTGGRPQMPDALLTPDRIREALLLLQAVEVSCATDGLLGGFHLHGPLRHDRTWMASKGGKDAYAHTLTEALTGLLDALGVTPVEWPSEDELRVFRTQFSADEDDVLRVLAGFFAAEPLMVLGLLVKLGGRDA